MEYTIKEVTELFGMSSYTLRYYEKEGLLPPVHRTENGRRQYDESDLSRIRMIRCMKAAGMSLESIKEFNRLSLNGEPALKEKQSVIRQQKELIENQIRDYQGLLKLLNRKLEHYDRQIAEAESDR
ncbi:hypothetical protein PSTEL_10550 [Paenibacillus stellifer]|uniref:HTH merR-type domain-containing protein n=1 Tax=Paenibacillus stellifer TaxID=169760 RepID=A0A089LRG4_9BACL|nr:MerR family transcriptional regulator [Paenibacillus stellifer]AIQ63457.1 hypothetical protein PSTEL_10550 [Paenibacillus stellifer]